MKVNDTLGKQRMISNVHMVCKTNQNLCERYPIVRSYLEDFHQQLLCKRISDEVTDIISNTVICHFDQLAVFITSSLRNVIIDINSQQ